jgi:CRISPR-associated endonuclease Cas1
MQPTDTLYAVIKNGVLTLSGYVISVREDMGCLLIKDGIKGAEIEHRFPRASCPFSRVMLVRSEGYITLAAVRWLHETGVSLIHLNYDGTPLLTSVPRADLPARLRRTQAALSVETRLGGSIARTLIGAKIAGQIANLQWLGLNSAASEAVAFAQRLEQRPSAPDLLGIEGMVSAIYWQALIEFPLQFGKQPAVADHWKTFGARHSTITGTPRGAVTPGNALLNYLYGVLASEITISLHTIGLDPTLGILHADKDNRPSLAYDLMEPLRPLLDHWFFDWLWTATFSKRDFREDIHGFIRCTHPLTSHLAMTAALWRSMAESVVQWFYKRLSGEQARLRLDSDMLATKGGRRAVRWRLGNSVQRPIPDTCAQCGKVLPERRRKFCSAQCGREYAGPVHAGIIAMARARALRAERGEKVKQTPTSIEAVSVRDWRRLPGWSKERDAEMQRWFSAELQPWMNGIRSIDIRRALDCSKSYSVEIKHGKRFPHPRLMRPLAALAGVEYPERFL